MKPIILASTSRARARLLESAGVAAGVMPPHVDEAALKSLLASKRASAAQVAQSLAEVKAREVSRRNPDAFVVGADQMLECDGAWLDKPKDRATARRQLLALRGKTHHLLTACAVAVGGEPVWQHGEVAQLTMREFSPTFLDEYLDKHGDEILDAVGSYHVEGPGAQLFSKVSGDVFGIQGLPLIPLLDFLRTKGAIPS